MVFLEIAEGATGIFGDFYMATESAQQFIEDLWGSCTLSLFDTVHKLELGREGCGYRRDPLAWHFQAPLYATVETKYTSLLRKHQNLLPRAIAVLPQIEHWRDRNTQARTPQTGLPSALVQGGFWKGFLRGTNDSLQANHPRKASSGGCSTIAALSPHARQKTDTATCFLLWNSPQIPCTVISKRSSTRPPFRWPPRRGT